MTLDQVIWTDTHRLRGTPCFRGTRVPVHTLTEYLAKGDSVDEFLRQFPTVPRELVVQYLRLAEENLTGRAA